ncbi:unnamed protein product [Soboliphyme baturini]|uniref:Endoplasmic reticulum-Golgi intermediate compartment protein 3 n=1 Tax=Soboliphyme baturini TaxID=241478 RepID=A0A183IB52_9BILA|nr:unnamed protein product [Soboliphyme baturini]
MIFLVTLICILITSLWFVCELSEYLKVDIVEELFVDTSTSDAGLQTNFDIVFYTLPCAFISVDLMDISGKHQNDVVHNVWKKRLDKNGKALEDVPEKEGIQFSVVLFSYCHRSNTLCFLGEFRCCKTCEDVKRAYAIRGWAMIEIERVKQCRNDAWLGKLVAFKNEGCEVYGHVKMSKVALLTDPFLVTHVQHRFDPVKKAVSLCIKKVLFTMLYSKLT